MTCFENLTHVVHPLENNIVIGTLECTQGFRTAFPIQSIITDSRKNGGQKLDSREETQEIEAQKWNTPFSKQWFVDEMLMSFLGE